MTAKGKTVRDKRNLLVHLSRGEYPFLKRDIFVKEFHLQRSYDKLRFCIIPSKAIRSLNIALALEEFGIGTPEPVALLEKRGVCNYLLYSCFITEYIADACILDEILKDDKHPMRHKLKDVLSSLAIDIRKMHDSGIIHNDLHVGNILISDIEKISIYYIDLNRARIKKKISIKQRIKDLARLRLKGEERRLFMKCYSPDNYQDLMSLMKQARKRRERFLDFKRRLKKLKKSLKRKGV